MKVIHQDGYSREELETFRNAIYKDVVDSAQSLVLAMVKMQKEFSRPENKVMADLVLEYSVKTDPSFILSPRIVDAIDSLYHDPMTAIIMDRCDFGQMDSTLYFISQVRRIGIDTYTPSVQDVLRVKPRTTGISETRFHMGQISVHMIDVGQTRSDRKKWIHCFESVTSIIFCVALSDYDLVLREEPEQNRMAENLVLFESVVNSRWFRQTAIILLMTDVDLFAAKLPKVPLENFFPDYTA
ncbi:Guanine nucleotide-binding protein alpha-2 subunit [Mortierella antarctica]|nr:Guanine nucleotide-binding protein alpha-2 subunit [Mortierella antarctica]